MPKAASDEVRRAARALRIDLLRQLGRETEADELAARPILSAADSPSRRSQWLAVVDAMSGESLSGSEHMSGESFGVHEMRSRVRNVFQQRVRTAGAIDAQVLYSKPPVETEQLSGNRDPAAGTGELFIALDVDSLTQAIAYSARARSEFMRQVDAPTDAPVGD